MPKVPILRLVFSLAAAAATGPVGPAHDPDIASGFHLLYELKFEEARAQFRSVGKSRPVDPLGPASEAASYLFEEFYRQGVLTSEFFLDDKRLLGGIPGKADTAIRKTPTRSSYSASRPACRRTTPA